MTSRSTFTMCGVVSLLFALGGCGGVVPSGDQPTSDLYGVFEAETRGDGTTLVTMTWREFTPDSNTTVELVEGDRATVTADGRTYDVNEIETPSGMTYETTVNTDAGGTEIQVSLEREEYEDAQNSSVTLPPGFEISEPASRAAVSRSSGFEVVLSDAPDGSNNELEVSGSCIQTYTQQFSGAEASVPPDAISKDNPESDDGEVPDSCTATVEVSRIRNGSLDAAYYENEGSFRAMQQRFRDITIEK